MKDVEVRYCANLKSDLQIGKSWYALVPLPLAGGETDRTGAVVYINAEGLIQISPYPLTLFGLHTGVQGNVHPLRAFVQYLVADYGKRMGVAKAEMLRRGMGVS